MSGRKLKSENNNTNAMNLLEIIKTNKSREKLIHCNYMYTIHKSAGVRTRWRCVARSKHCRGAVTTLRDCNNKVTSLNINIGHNHPPNLRAVEQAQLKFSLDPPIVLGKFSEQQNAQLISLRIKYEKYFNSSRQQSWEGWDFIRTRMGLDSSLQVQMLRKRWHNLVAKYKTIRDNPCSNGPEAWSHFSVLHRYLANSKKLEDLGEENYNNMRKFLEPDSILHEFQETSSVSTNIKPSTSGSRGSNIGSANNNNAALQQQRQQHKHSPPATTTKQQAESPIREMLVQMEDHRRKRAPKTRKKQFEIYVSFLEQNRPFALGKIDPNIQDYSNVKWEELCQSLNSCGAGPSRTISCWKAIFMSWKHQTRAKARKIKEYIGGKGESVCTLQLSNIEERALAAWGQGVLDGHPDVNMIVEYSNQELVQMEDQRRKRAPKTKNEQFELYVSFLEQNRPFALGKIDPDTQDYFNIKWEELCESLNSCGTGPSRTISCWKAIFMSWKNQTRAKARKIKEHVAGKGESVCTLQLSNIEERALVAWGPGAMDGPMEFPNQEQSSTTPPLVSLCQDVCLRWNSYHSNMQQSFPMLLDTEQFVDVTLACEGQFIKCHKMVLSACSSFFAELFQQNPCPHPVIVLRGSKMWEIRALVDFMYRGEVNVQQDRLASLLAAAEELQVKGLAGSTTKLPESSSPEPSFNHGGHSTDEGQKYQTTQQHKKILKRKATYPQYNEYREIRPAPPSLTKLNMQPHNFISLIPKNVEVPDNSVPNTKNIKRKSRINATRTDPENDIQTDQNTTDELVPVKEECMDYEYRARNLDEILNFNTDNSMMDNTDNNTDDDYGSNKYSEDNINRHEIDPLGVDDERNEIEENIEEAYD